MASRPRFPVSGYAAASIVSRGTPRGAILIRHARAALAVAVAASAAHGLACSSRAPGIPTAPSPGAGVVYIMGVSRLDGAQLSGWFNGRQPRPAGFYAASVPVEQLAQYYIEEGAAEGVTGDVAFVQAIVETGWFRFQGAVPAWKNNFAGIGAATGAEDGAAAFPDARTGVRAQIQHLRAYADPAASACAVPPLSHPCVDPRFDLVVPKGKAPAWNQLGNGNWAAASTYAASILTLYDEARAYNGVR